MEKPTLRIYLSKAGRFLLGDPQGRRLSRLAIGAWLAFTLLFLPFAWYGCWMIWDGWHLHALFNASELSTWEAALPALPLAALFAARYTVGAVAKGLSSAWRDVNACYAYERAAGRES